LYLIVVKRRALQKKRFWRLSRGVEEKCPDEEGINRGLG
jgi:hypothetical protein